VRRALVALALTAFAVAAPAGATLPRGRPYWTPTPAQVAKLESQTSRKPGMAPTWRYGRDYAGVTLDDRKMIVGRWVRDDSGRTIGVRIGPLSAIPDIADGGCSVVSVMYDVKTEHLVSMTCNGNG